MNNKSIFIVGTLLLAVLVSACGGATTINQAAAPAVRTISVSGSGQAFLEPDIAYIYLGVHTEKLTASEAVAENTSQTEAMIQALRDFGIDAKDIRTTNFSI